MSTRIVNYRFGGRVLFISECPEEHRLSRKQRCAWVEIIDPAENGLLKGGETVRVDLIDLRERHNGAALA